MSIADQDYSDYANQLAEEQAGIETFDEENNAQKEEHEAKGAELSNLLFEGEYVAHPFLQSVFKTNSFKRLNDWAGQKFDESSIGKKWGDFKLYAKNKFNNVLGGGADGDGVFSGALKNLGIVPGDLSPGDLMKLSRGDNSPLQNLKKAASDKVQSVKDQVSDRVSGIKDQVGAKVQSVKDQASDLKTQAVDRAQSMRDQVGERVSGIKDQVGAKVQSVKDQASDLQAQATDRAQSMRDQVSERVSGIKDQVGTKVQSVKDQVSDLQAQATDRAQSMRDQVGGKVSDAKSQFDTGLENTRDMVGSRFESLQAQAGAARDTTTKSLLNTRDEALTRLRSQSMRAKAQMDSDINDGMFGDPDNISLQSYKSLGPGYFKRPRGGSLVTDETGEPLGVSSLERVPDATTFMAEARGKASGFVDSLKSSFKTAFRPPAAIPATELASSSLEPTEQLTTDLTTQPNIADVASGFRDKGASMVSEASDAVKSTGTDVIDSLKSSGSRLVSGLGVGGVMVGLGEAAQQIPNKYGRFATNTGINVAGLDPGGHIGDGIKSVYNGAKSSLRRAFGLEQQPTEEADITPAAPVEMTDATELPVSEEAGTQAQSGAEAGADAGEEAATDALAEGAETVGEVDAATSEIPVVGQAIDVLSGLALVGMSIYEGIEGLDTSDLPSPHIADPAFQIGV